jgi:hypothetical protein
MGVMVLLITSESRGVEAQSMVCGPIRPGETASAVARRLTGDAGYRQASWFQIVDPATGRRLPKSSHNRIPVGWRACLTQSPLADASRSRPTLIAMIGTPLQQIVTMMPGADPGLLLLSVLAGIAGAFLCISVADYLAERQRIVAAMKGFGESFVREFERPLLQPPVGSPLRSQLVVSPDRRQLSILLAPAAGHRYPNLSDHRDNVAYDVGRVVQQLRDHSFVCAAPYTKGGWVVVPFRFQDDPNQAGGL